VLQDQRRIGEGEAPIGEEREILRAVAMQGAAIGMPILPARDGQHRGRNVYTVAAVEPVGERERQAADTAAEVERAPV